MPQRLVRILQEIIKTLPYSLVIYKNNGEHIYANIKGKIHEENFLAELFNSIKERKQFNFVYRNDSYFCNVVYYEDFIIVICDILQGSGNYLKQFRIFEKVFNLLKEGVHILNEREETVFANLSAMRCSGFDNNDIIGKNINILSYLKNLTSSLYNEIKEQIKRGEVWEGEIWVQNREKHLIPVISEIFSIENNSTAYIVEIFQDLSELKKQQEYSEYLKYYNDFLDLPNKNFLKRKISKIPNCTGIIITLSNLRKINDLYGFDIGDEFLKFFAEKLSVVTSTFNGKLFYVGGNQFVYLLKSLDKGITEKLIHKIIKLEENTFSLNKYFINPVILIGITLNKGNKSFGKFMNELEIAHDYAKNNELKYSVYNEKFKEKVTTAHKIELLIKEALKNDKFILYYQPRVNLKTNKVTSAEALIRMLGEDGKIISPGLFIPIAEHSKLINEIGEWVVSNVFDDARYIAVKSDENLKFSFNISSNQFSQPDFIDTLEELIKHSKDYLPKFEIEITEWAMMKNVENSIKKMQQIKDLGFELIIDDFGTGYSSLGYLKDFPINYIKIDKSFTDNIPGDIKTEKITKSIIYLAKQLDLAITVEGVENTEQFEWFKSAECDEIQGYYFSKPLPVEDFIKFVKVINRPVRSNKYLTWVDESSVGISGFDIYHMIILNLLNSLYDEIHKKEKDKIVLSKYFESIYHYITFHFKDEENFMIKHKFSEYEEHKKEHDRFRTIIGKLKFSYEKGNEKTEHELFSILKDWWQNHILQWDKKLKAFVNNN